MSQYPKLFLLLFIFLQISTLNLEALQLLRNKRLTALHEVENEKDQLILVQLLWRHGDRNPERTFASDPPDTWPGGLAELTTKGMEQMVELGRKLRIKYIDTLKLVSPYYSSNEVYFRSSDTNRTLLSVTANLIGFYGKGRRGIDYPDIDGWPDGFVPVPVHTHDWRQDNFFNQYIRCARAETARELLKRSPIYQGIKEKTKSLFEQLSVVTKTNVTVENCYFLYDIWHVHRLYNVPMPPEYTDELYEQFEVIEHIMNDYQFGVGIDPFNGMDLRRELTRLRGGPILGKILEHMKAKVDCMNRTNDKSCQWIKNLRYHAFSGHDTTIQVVFSSFGFNETNYRDHSEPGYAACVSFELWQRPNNEFYVKILYFPAKNGTFDMTADVQGCQHECELSRFVQRSKPYVLDRDFERQCLLPEAWNVNLREFN